MVPKILDSGFFVYAIAWGLTAIPLAAISRTAHGTVAALSIGLLAALFVRFILSDRDSSVVFVMNFPFKGYAILALGYALILGFLFVDNTLFSQSRLVFSEWGNISLFDYSRLLMSVLVIYFFPGYFILSVIDRKRETTGLNTLIFSFLLSCLYTPGLSLFSLFFLGEISVGHYVIFSFLLLLICVLFPKEHRTAENSTNIQLNFVLLLVILVFLIGTFAFAKDYGYVEGIDVWRHQGGALRIMRYGFEAVKITEHPGWFHLQLACLFEMSNFPLVNLSLLLNILNVMPILAFFSATRAIFRKEIAGLAPPIATMFFALFSGFGWIYAVNKIFLQGNYWLTSLTYAGSLVSNDTLFSNIWIWGFSPACVGFTAFFMLLFFVFLDTRNERLIFFLSLLTFTLAWTVHASEALIFVILFGVILVFSKSVRFDRKLSMSLALIVGLTTALTISLCLLDKTYFWYLLGLIYLFVLLSLILVLKKKPRNIDPSKSLKFLALLSGIFVTVLYLSSFLIWGANEELLFNASRYVSDIGAVAWYVYPMRMGIVGIFALLGSMLIGYADKDFYGVKPCFMTFLCLAGTLFVLGKAITLFKVFFGYIDYWEIRILRFYLDAVVSVMATLFIFYVFVFMKNRFVKEKIEQSKNRVEVKAVKKPKRPSEKRVVAEEITLSAEEKRKKKSFALNLTSRKFRPKTKLFVIILLSLMVVFGTASTVFTIDYCAGRQRRWLTSDLEFIATTLKENVLFSNRSVTFTALSPLSVDALNRLGIQQLSDPPRTAIALSSAAETYYFISWFAYTKENYLLYMPDLDGYIFKAHEENFLYSTVIQVEQTLSEGEDFSIFELPYGSPPVSNSTVLLIPPTRYSRNVILDMFALTNRSYDVAFIDALTGLNNYSVIATFDPIDGNFGERLLKVAESGKTLLIFNVNNSGFIADKLSLTDEKPVSLETADSIVSAQRSIKLPFAMKVPVLNTSDASSFFALDGSIVSPFVLQKQYGSGKIVYVNVFPLSSCSQMPLSESMNFVLDVLHLPKFDMSKEFVDDHFDIYAARVNMTGCVNIYTKSISVIQGSDFQFNSSDNSNIMLLVTAEKEVSIQPSNIGTYAEVSIVGPFELSIFRDETVERHSFKKSAVLLMKDPSVSASGEVVVHEAFRRDRWQDWKRTLVFNGEVSFNIRYPNVYLFIFDFDPQGTLKSLASPYEFCQMYPLLEKVNEASHYLLIVALTIIVVAIIIRLRGRKMLLSISN